MTPRDKDRATELLSGWMKDGNRRWFSVHDDLRDRIAEALAAERDACAKIADKYASNHSMTALMTALMIAQAIRTGRSEGTP
jgi:uncharacterized protein (DUF924 family)